MKLLWLIVWDSILIETEKLLGKVKDHIISFELKIRSYNKREISN